MASADTRSADWISRKSGRSPFPTWRRASPARPLLRIGEMKARRAWSAAMKRREGLQARIVLAFARQVEGSGVGPVDADLKLFARSWVIEKRLQRALVRLKAHQSGTCAASSALAPLMARGEFR